MNRPYWVTVGLVMLHTREQAMVYLVASTVAAVLVFVGAIAETTYFHRFSLLAACETGAALGGLVLLLPVWLWRAIRWMDRHEGW